MNGLRYSRALCVIMTGLVLLTSAGCASMRGNRRMSGAAIGAISGAALGAVLNDRHRSRNAALGAVLGAAVGAAIGDRMQKAAERAARENQPVVITSDDGTTIHATPTGTDGDNRIVDIEYKDSDGNVVKKETKTVPLS